MPLGGGNFTDFNKKINGVYTRFITRGRPRTEITNGIVAGGIVSDWAPDGVYTIEKEDFIADPESVTGYAYSDPKNAILREIFAHANRLYTYRLNKGGKPAKVSGVGQAKYNGSAGNKITVSVLKNILDDQKYDVTTYFNDVEKDLQTVPQAGVDEIKLTKGTEKSETTVEQADVSFTFKDNQITVQFSSVPEGYKPSVRVKGQIGSILAFTPGRMEDTELQSGNKHIISYYPGAAINGTMTVEACLTKDKIQVLKSCTYTCQLNEDVQVGADGSQLKDNTYVSFEDGVLLENAGYTFSGGSSNSTVNASGHSDFLNKLEGKEFSYLFYDGTDEGVKALYAEYTKRLRDERGIYFQTILQDYKDADYEGIISIYNTATCENVNTLTPWLAGLLSALSLSQEGTNRLYDGEMSVIADLSQSRMEQQIDSGNFFFHEENTGEIYTYEDVNTFRSYTDDKNEEVSQNKVIRVVDYIHNSVARVSKRMDIGRLDNTEEGRNILWSRIDAVLTELVDQGAIENYEPTDIEVLEIKDQKDAVEIHLNITVRGTIRKIYITTYIVQ